MNDIISDEKKKRIEEQMKKEDEMIKEYEDRYKEKLLTINLSTENNYDSQHKYPPATIFYNKAELQDYLDDNFRGQLEIPDFWKLMDTGRVAIYSEIEKKFVDEIKREIFDTDFERRIRYYLPDGTRFVDVKTICKTP